MQLDFVSLQWVFAGGYEWYDSGDYLELHIGQAGTIRRKTVASQRRLRGKPLQGKIERISSVDLQCDPFKSCPALFLKFAELQGSEESILKFTDTYGRLWDDLSGPCLADYREAIDDLRDAVELWRAVQGRDDKKLAQYVEWDRAGRLKWKSRLSQPVAHDERTVYFIDVHYSRHEYKPGDLIGPATDLLDFVVATRPTWSMKIKPVRHSGTLALQLHVRDLLYIIWIQFALAVAGDKSYGRCQHCGDPFELTPQVNRADRVFCTNSCRVKAYQRRKKQALSLRQQGQPLRAIAKTTGSDLETVKRWVAKAKPKET